MNNKEHWEKIYESNSNKEMSWFQAFLFCSFKRRAA
jgi:hypothetical protein